MVEVKFINFKCLTCICANCIRNNECAVDTENQGMIGMCDFCNYENYAGLDECPFNDFKKNKNRKED